MNNTGTSVLTVTTSGAQAALAPAMENGSGQALRNRPANPRDVAGRSRMEDAEPEKAR